MTLRDLLLHTYPRSWRKEYGEEFVAILTQTQLTPRLTADILLNGARQHFLRDDPWKFCGVGLTLWFLTLHPLAALILGHFNPWWYLVAFPLVSLAGALTVRRNVGVWSATAASAKAALVGHIGLLVLYAQALPYWGPNRYLGHTICFWAAKSLALCLALCLALGFLGAAVGRLWKASPAPQSH
jgi:hypothetical protein